MTSAARNLEGSPNHCPVCGAESPADAGGKTVCAACGYGDQFDATATDDTLLVDMHATKLLTPELLNAIGKALSERNLKQLSIDMSKVEYISSAVLGKLVNLKKGQGLKKLELRSLSPDLLEIFRLTRLDQAFDIS